MRHAKAKYRLNRFTSWRKATLLSLAKNLITYQSIKTTRQKAKAVRPLIERLIFLAKVNSLTARRRAYSVLQDHKLVNLLFNDLGQRFTDRTGGYTRIFGLGRRRGDNAELVLLELTVIKKKEPRKLKKEKAVEPREEKKPEIIKEKPPVTLEAKKQPKRFLGGLRRIFKKERDAL